MPFVIRTILESVLRTLLATLAPRSTTSSGQESLAGASGASMNRHGGQGGQVASETRREFNEIFEGHGDLGGVPYSSVGGEGITRP